MPFGAWLTASSEPACMSSPSEGLKEQHVQQRSGGEGGYADYR